MTVRYGLTWWGHSTTCLEQDGVRLLTDPILVDRVAHLRRRRGPTPSELPAYDAVLISHLHADHLHVPSLRQLGGRAPLVVPAGALGFVRRVLGVEVAQRCVELAVGESYIVGEVQVLAVPATHHGGRHPWSRHHAPALGFVVSGSVRTWFGGDTGLHPAMSSFGPVDLALVPVGGWGPSLGPGHLHPATAVEAVGRIGARWAVPIHYGTFWPYGMDPVKPHLFHDPGERFAHHAAERLPDLDVRVLHPGDSLTLIEAR